MANSVMLKAKGLYTFQNFLSAIPEGSLLDATNIVIDRDGIIEPRRGIKQYGDFGSAGSRAKQLLSYKNQVLVHYASKLAYDDGTGNITDFSGSFTDTQTGLRMKGVELNGNYYVTTGTGIKKISAATTDLSLADISDAGGIKALTGTGVVNYDVPGFFSGLSKVAYRIVWGTKDVNNNLILGTPSSRIVITNFDTNSGTVDLTFTVPADITTDYFYQVYRTSVSTAASLTLLDEVDPGDEMRLVFEEAYVSGTEITVSDITPDDFQAGGTYLYTNPVTGEGILQANEKPPVAKDIALFKNSVFYANTRTRHTMELNLLGLGGLTSGNITAVTVGPPAQITSNNHGLSNGDRIAIVGTGAVAVDTTHVVSNVTTHTFELAGVNGTGASATGGTWYSSYVTVTDGTTTNRYFFVGRPEITDITFDTKANTTGGSWFTIYSAEDQVKYYIWFNKTGSDTEPTVTNAVGIEVDITTATSAEDVAAAVQTAVEAATNDFNITSTGAGLRTFTTANNGAATDAAPGSTPPGGVFAISIDPENQGFGEDATKKYIRWSGYASTAQAVDDTARSMTNVINKNASEIIYGYYLSGPDDVPGLMNYERRSLADTAFSFQANNASVGALFNPDITSAQSSTDEEAPNRLYFSKYSQPEAVPIVNYLDIGPKDKIIQRIVPLRDSLFIFKEDGIYRLTGEVAPNFSVTLFDNSTELIAPDSAAVLNNQIYAFTDGGIATVTETGVGIVSRPIENVLRRVATDNFTNYSTASFGIGYEPDRSYFIWTVTNMDDTYATQCFRFNTFTQCWTRWDLEQTCGVVNSSLLYLGSADTNYVDTERKSLTRTDFADKSYSLIINNNPILSDTTMYISSAANIDDGDALIQTQYVTINTFNSLLLKLDADPRVGMTPGTFDTDYYATLAMSKGDNLTNKMISLVAKLNADAGTDGGYTFSGTSVFATIQTEYNTMITAMNLDTKLKFTNYKESNGTTDVEMTIDAADANTNIIESESIPLLMVGPVTHYKGIRATVVWAPSTLGDPTLLKHVRESTMLFEDSAFRGASVAFNTDLSPSFESVSFDMDGNGTWGGFFWGENNWGGSGSSVPFRTYIPRQKQRCRYIRNRFIHHDAFYKFAILGTSYVFEISSERAYRGKNG